MKSLIAIFLVSLLLLAARPATGGDVAGFGTWRITTLSGEITIVDESRSRTRSWTFNVDPEASGANWVRVYSRGELEYSVAFKGVEGSPHPDGYRHGGSGRGEGGLVMGHNVHEESGGPDGYHSRVEKAIKGTYSDVEMEADWTLSNVISAGHITQTITGSGSFKAVRGRAP